MNKDKTEIIATGNKEERMNVIAQLDSRAKKGTLVVVVAIMITWSLTIRMKHANSGTSFLCFQ